MSTSQSEGREKIYIYFLIMCLFNLDYKSMETVPDILLSMQLFLQSVIYYASPFLLHSMGFFFL